MAHVGLSWKYFLGGISASKIAQLGMINGVYYNNSFFAGTKKLK